MHIKVTSLIKRERERERERESMNTSLFHSNIHHFYTEQNAHLSPFNNTFRAIFPASSSLVKKKIIIIIKLEMGNTTEG